jgi:transposase
MARAYSDDLRRKLLEAHAAGKGTLRDLAGRFGVSVGWAFKVSAAKRQTGSSERLPQRRAASRIDLERVRKLVEDKPDIILRELQAELRRAGQPISLAHMARLVKRLGLRLKKSRSTPPNATPKPTDSGVKRSSPGSARSHPRT